MKRREAEARKRVALDLLRAQALTRAAQAPLAGPQGPAGPPGAAARIELSEETGEVSVVGKRGPQGEPGPRGPQGERGPRGERGETGSEGRRGERGERGERGPVGLQGLPGERGERGPVGLPGVRGPTGEKGKSGEGFTWKGLHSSTATYQPNDVVEYQGSSWVALRQTQSSPTIGQDWDLMAAAGRPGPAAPSPEDASPTQRGLMNTLAQSFEGVKTFLRRVVLAVDLQFADLTVQSTAGISPAAVAAAYLPLAGGTISGGLTVGGFVTLQGSGQIAGNLIIGGAIVPAAAANPALTVKGVASQSGNLLQTKNSSDQSLLEAKPDGSVKITARNAIPNVGKLFEFVNADEISPKRWGWYVGGQGNYEGYIKFGMCAEIEASNNWAVAIYDSGGGTYRFWFKGWVSAPVYAANVQGLGDVEEMQWIPDGTNYHGKTRIGINHPYGAHDVELMISADAGYFATRDAEFSVSNQSTGDKLLRQSSRTGNMVMGRPGASAAAPPTGATAAALTLPGKVDFDSTDASGTPGPATINKAKGFAAVANGASSVTITNSMVAAGSLVIPVLMDVTDAVQIKGVVVSAGSFTIHLTGVTTGARKVGFIVH